MGCSCRSAERSQDGETKKEKPLDRSYPAACSSGYPLVKVGSKNNYVMILQDALNNMGRPLSIDGIFGNNTKNAVIKFQRYYGLKADGIVGCNTWRKIASIANGMGVSAYTKYYN